MNQTYPTSKRYPGIPTQKAIEPAVLEYVHDGQLYRFRDIYAAMGVCFELTREQEMITFPYARNRNQDTPGGENVFYKYCNNACQNLVNEGCLNDGGVGFSDDKMYSITETGLHRISGGFR